jgi:hypothetical protein
MLWQQLGFPEAGIADDAEAAKMDSWGGELLPPFVIKILTVEFGKEVKSWWLTLSSSRGLVQESSVQESRVDKKYASHLRL